MTHIHDYYCESPCPVEHKHTKYCMDPVSGWQVCPDWKKPDENGEIYGN